MYGSIRWLKLGQMIKDKNKVEKYKTIRGKRFQYTTCAPRWEVKKKKASQKWKE